MHNNEAELMQALKKMLHYVSTSYDVHTIHAVYIPAAEQMRRNADALDKKDKEIEEARALIRRIESSHP